MGHYSWLLDTLASLEWLKHCDKLKLNVFFLSCRCFGIHYQGAWSLSECSHWSFWLDTICMGEDKFGGDPFPKQCSKYYSILVRIKPMNRCLKLEGYKLISQFASTLFCAVKPWSLHKNHALHDFIWVQNVNFLKIHTRTGNIQKRLTQVSWCNLLYLFNVWILFLDCKILYLLR